MSDKKHHEGTVRGCMGLDSYGRVMLLIEILYDSDNPDALDWMVGTKCEVIEK